MPLCDACTSRKGHSYSFNTLQKTSCEFCRLVYEGVNKLVPTSVPNRQLYSITFPPFQTAELQPFKVNVFAAGIDVSLWCIPGKFPVGKIYCFGNVAALIGH